MRCYGVRQAPPMPLCSYTLEYCLTILLWLLFKYYSTTWYSYMWCAIRKREENRNREANSVTSGRWQEEESARYDNCYVVRPTVLHPETHIMMSMTNGRKRLILRHQYTSSTPSYYWLFRTKKEENRRKPEDATKTGGPRYQTNFMMYA